MLISNEHEAERGVILLILQVRYPDPLPFFKLRAAVVRQGFEVTDASMKFHVGYLRDKGYVATETLQAGSSDITLSTIRLTARGADLIDKRLAADPGVAF